MDGVNKSIVAVLLQNIVFGMACINDETYELGLEIIFTRQGQRTDGDLALCKAVDEEKGEGHHFICQWRNFSKNFAFLKSLKMIIQLQRNLIMINGKRIIFKVITIP